MSEPHSLCAGPRRLICRLNLDGVLPEKRSIWVSISEHISLSERGVGGASRGAFLFIYLLFFWVHDSSHLPEAALYRSTKWTKGGIQQASPNFCRRSLASRWVENYTVTSQPFISLDRWRIHMRRLRCWQVLRRGRDVFYFYSDVKLLLIHISTVKENIPTIPKALMMFWHFSTDHIQPYIDEDGCVFVPVTDLIGFTHVLKRTLNLRKLRLPIGA